MFAAAWANNQYLHSPKFTGETPYSFEHVTLVALQRHKFFYGDLGRFARQGTAFKLPRSGKPCGSVCKKGYESLAIKRRIDEAEGRAALRQWATAVEAESTVSRPVLATAVRFSLEELAARAEGNSVEVRIPPFGVTQCITGPRHTRGTPPNVVEMPADLWLRLATGKQNWADAKQTGQLHASGLRADLSAHLPLIEYP